MTLGIMTLGIMTLNRMTSSIVSLNKTIIMRHFSIIKFSIGELRITR